MRVSVRARLATAKVCWNRRSSGVLSAPWWRAACQAYYEYEHSHNPPTAVDLNKPDDCQWDYAFRQGDSAFYVLDMRGHHDVEKNKGKKTGLDPNILLGQAQFDRFTAWLDSADTKAARDAAVAVAAERHGAVQRA